VIPYAQETQYALPWPSKAKQGPFMRESAKVIVCSTKVYGLWFMVTLLCHPGALKGAPARAPAVPACIQLPRTNSLSACCWNRCCSWLTHWQHSQYCLDIQEALAAHILSCQSNTHDYIGTRSSCTEVHHLCTKQLSPSNKQPDLKNGPVMSSHDGTHTSKYEYKGLTESATYTGVGSLANSHTM
jgi:hypothetical protein